MVVSTLGIQTVELVLWRIGGSERATFRIAGTVLCRFSEFAYINLGYWSRKENWRACGPGILEECPSVPNNEFISVDMRNKLAMQFVKEGSHLSSLG
jgi:hypothetical protein